MWEAATRKAIEAVWRIESARLIGGLVRIVRDVGLAEDLAQEALVSALERWPETGIPENPGAWLTAAAKNRAIDQLRRQRMLERKQDVIEDNASAGSLRPPEIETAIFNEGYAATRGDDWMRTELCEDALRLGRILAGLVPEEAEVHGLVALMELHGSRARARVGPSGEPILLLDQDRARWDHLLIQRGLAALSRAESLAQPLAPYALQAAIAACHARAQTGAETDWKKIVVLHEAPGGRDHALCPAPPIAS